jgi:hypothetical protein
MPNPMEHLDHSFRPANKHAEPTAPARKRRRGRSETRGRIAPNRHNQKEAEAAMLIAWREWLENILPKKVGDGEVHEFLRFIKTERPDLLHFPSKITPMKRRFAGSWALTWTWSQCAPASELVQAEFRSKSVETRSGPMPHRRSGIYVLLSGKCGSNSNSRWDSAEMRKPSQIRSTRHWSD